MSRVGRDWANICRVKCKYYYYDHASQLSWNKTNIALGIVPYESLLHSNKSNIWISSLLHHRDV